MVRNGVLSENSFPVFVRGVDQTGRALQKPLKDLTALEKAQARLARTTYRLMFAGAAFLTFGAMITRSLAGLLEYTSLGQLYLEDFTRTFDRLKQGLAEAIMDRFGPMIEGWIESLDNLSKNEAWMDLMAGIVVPIAFTLTTVGIVLLAATITAKIITTIIGAFVTAGLLSAEGGAAAIAGGTLGVITLGISVVLAIAIKKILTSFFPGVLEEHRKTIEDLVSGRAGLGGGEGIPITIDGQPQTFLGQPLVVGGPLRNIIINVQNFFDNIHTEADIEELSDVVEEGLINAIETASGNLKP